MKKSLLVLYIFFCACCAFSQGRQNTVVAEVDFNRPPTIVIKPSYLKYADTVRAALQVTRGHMTIAHERMGYVVFRLKDTIYLDDRKRQLKAPVKVWSFIKAEK